MAGMADHTTDDDRLQYPRHMRLNPTLPTAVQTAIGTTVEAEIQLEQWVAQHQKPAEGYRHPCGGTHNPTQRTGPNLPVRPASPWPPS